MVLFLLRTNLIGCVRLGHLEYKEVIAWYKAGHIDAEAVDEYLEIVFIDVGEINVINLTQLDFGI